MTETKNKLTTYFTFGNNGEEAVKYYVSIFPNSKIENITTYGKNERVEEGLLLNATFELNGQRFMAMDIGKGLNPEFTWAISILVDCKDENEFDTIFNKLSQDGVVLMGPEEVYDIKKAAWITDKYGVTWQLIWQ